jgi:hypothetical protein
MATGGDDSGAVVEEDCKVGRGRFACVASNNKIPVRAAPAQATRAGLRHKSRHK